MTGLRSAGVDSGTYSVDIVAIEETDNGFRVFYEEAIPRRLVVEQPSIIVEKLEKLVEEGVSSIVMSSGYGVPLKRAQEAAMAEIRAATFIHQADEERGLRILGLRRAMMLLAESGLPVWFTPGVVHLPTVPRWRKLNKIDMGTSDKVYSVAAALREEVEDRGTPIEKADLIVLEVGYAYTAAIAVSSGRIVDGIGGSAGFTGYMGAGAWDSELAYLAAFIEPGFSKERLFEGGAAALLEDSWPPPGPDTVARRAAEGDIRAQEVIEALAESAAKDVLALLTAVTPRRVYVTGRWWRVGLFRQALEEKLNPVLSRLGIETTGLSYKGTAKEAALGAALLANGLAGGRYSWIVEALRLRESRGTIFDYIVVGGLAEKARSYYGLD
ncbi:hypothetical protein Pyrde_0678 [Pyrodictium delaneyi]|uniref:Butyrate kinase n=1 Tax=Pyrodictium delaneyi TaxID=1273541 RepID=A0A0P0N1I2_9CREN|nr:DUF1464 family protein [Pyrodictium delaneyi]ALL00728.1 hypothetical protein Pyrde_0678 [Pyrodictium delaneyi]OWJ54167.1 hypothetical protein Pdsh_10000 [Pyrodictium delaneyi]